MPNFLSAAVNFIIPYIKPLFIVIKPLVMVLLIVPTGETDSSIVGENDESIEFLLDTVKELNVKEEELTLDKREPIIEKEKPTFEDFEKAKEEVLVVLEKISKSFGLDIELRSNELSVEGEGISIDKGILLLEEYGNELQRLLEKKKQ